MIKRNKEKKPSKENKKEKERKRNVGLRQIGTPSKSKGAINVIGIRLKIYGKIPDFLILLKR